MDQGGKLGVGIALAALILGVPSTLVSLNELGSIDLYEPVISSDDKPTAVPSSPFPEIPSVKPSGTVSLTPKAGPYDQTIIVSGTNWPPNRELEVSAGPKTVSVSSAADGTFRTDFTLDPSFEFSVDPGGSVEFRVQLTGSALGNFPASTRYTVTK